MEKSFQQHVYLLNAGHCIHVGFVLGVPCIYCRPAVERNVIGTNRVLLVCCEANTEDLRHRKQKQ